MGGILASSISMTVCTPHICPLMMLKETTSCECVPVPTDEAVFRRSWWEKLLAKTGAISRYPICSLPLRQNDDMQSDVYEKEKP